MMKPEIDYDRLARVTRLKRGKNPFARAFRGGDDDMCAMEAVAYIAGEPWSDHPWCACPVITVFMISWNDALPDDERSSLLLPLIPKLVGTRSTPEVEQRRSLMAADWLMRTHTPAWLRLAGLTAQADALAGLPEITSMAQVPGLLEPIEAVRRAAVAARTATWDAAWDATRTAARTTAGSAAWVAAWVATRDADLDAVWVYAMGAAVDAARISAAAAFESTKRELQQSAVQLVERMCAFTPEML